MNDKIAFFDMDGTITAPRFLDDGKPVVGFNLERWIEHCETQREHAYDHCGMQKTTIDFARKLKTEGYELRILTVAMSEGERVAKRHFIAERGLSMLFDSIMFVGSDDAKTPTILAVAFERGIDPSCCMLVEDHYYNCLRAHDAGIRAVHISNIIADNVSG